MGIDGAVHRVQDICYTKSILEDFGFLLVDAKIAFNYINIIGMLWTVCHLCLSKAHFVFNRYRHWSLLVLRNRNGKDSLCTVGGE